MLFDFYKWHEMVLASGGGGPMLVPPVAQSGTGGRPVGEASVPRAPATSGATGGLWPLAPAQPGQVTNQQSHGTPPLAATPAPAHNQGVNRYGLYSLFPGGGGGSYVAATPATPGPPTPTRTYHATTHKVSESVFSAAVGVGVGGYTWGAPTPPPGSPYSPVPVTQLELLAKNLASLAPPGQQPALSLQSVGVNVNSLHHAQHTQHTLNLATGLHHLHHGGLHQSTFSPQLSLVTNNAPTTLTINGFSSTNASAGVVPNTGVLLQEYQSPTGGTAAPASCATTIASASATNGLLVQTSNTQTVHGKKRDAFLPSQGQPVKLENGKSTRQPCVCKTSTGKTKVVHSDAGCSRTLPVASSWSGQNGAPGGVSTGPVNGTINGGLIKREPVGTVPCQVAEVSTSLHATTTTAVKIEPLAAAKPENGIVVSSAAGGGIPVGIAVARQRLQHHESTTSTSSSSSMRNVSLSHHTSHHASSYHHFQPDGLGTSAAMTVGGTLLHCATGEDRTAAHLAIPSGSLASTLGGMNATAGTGLNSTIGGIAGLAATSPGSSATATWPPTLWQYPAGAAATAAMPMEPVGFPQMGVGLQSGLQLVRDPTTGQLLLIHAAEHMPQAAVVWPNYPGHNSSSVVPPPLLLPPPPPSLQLLSDIGGARLVLTESKRKQQSTLPIVKIEADCTASPTAIITSTESTKALQTVTSVTGTLVPDTPLVTTLHYYPHAPALVQISQTDQPRCRSQCGTFLSKATSPVSCLTPPPEMASVQPVETDDGNPIGVQDASNQTDAPEEDHESVDSYVKLEQVSPSYQTPQNGPGVVQPPPAHLSTSLTNMTNIELMATAPEKVCNVLRITTTTTTVNPGVCGIVGKVDKAENTIINMADCPKYSYTKECRSVTSIDRTIEHVITARRFEANENLQTKEEEEDEELATDESRQRSLNKELRIRPRIIEITEDNCDSFHENLEFFGRRQDHVEDYSEREGESISEEVLDAKFEPKAVEKDGEISEFTPSIVPAIETKIPEVSNLRHEVANERKTTTCAPTTSHGRIAVKSFDMPSIDCEEQATEVSTVVVKRETEDAGYENRAYSTLNDKQKHQDANRKHSTDKCHAGIENVVEKLKKNAAALQETVQRVDEVKEKPRQDEAIPQRKLENGLKKHILRSVERNNEVNSVNSLKVENGSCSPQKIYTTSECCLVDKNANDCKSNNKNIKMDGGLSTVPVKKEKNSETLKRDDNKEELNCNQADKKPKPSVDLSGLELLSNSIEQFVHLNPESKNNEKSPNGASVITQQTETNNNVNSPLGLLCALAEQRFLEEVGDVVTRRRNPDSNPNEELSQAGKLLLNLGKTKDNEKRNLDKRKHPDENENPKRRKLDYEDGDVNGLYNIETELKNHKNSKQNHDYSNSHNKFETVRTVKEGSTESDNRPNVDTLGLDTRTRLADIEKQYIEKQKELTKLASKKDEKKSPGRPRKKSSSSTDYGVSTTPVEESTNSVHKLSRSPDDVASLGSSVLGVPRCNVNLVKVGEPRSHIKLLDSIPSIPIPVSRVVSPITVLPVSKITLDDDEKSNGTVGYDTSSPAPTVASSSSASKKRKVGRPRKLMCTSGSARHFTETIVAKKPKSKNSLVGYVLSSKNRHLPSKFISKTGYTPLPFKSSMSSIKSSKCQRIGKPPRQKPVKQTPLHSKNVISSIIAEKAKLNQDIKLEKCNKQKPRAKVEEKVTETYEDGENETVEDSVIENVISKEPFEEIASEIKENQENESEIVRYEKIKKKKRKSSSISPSRRKSTDRDRKDHKRRKSSDCKECKECAKVAKAERIESIINSCKLTPAHLAIDKLRVLTAMGGLFYAGELRAVEPPDVYAIHLDGERGNRPHIHSREEILRDAIVEVQPSSAKELLPGTRLCAYWSQQYRCLYPGTSVEPNEPDSEQDEKYVSVEFDDGDSGRIELKDIRFLQPDYPVVEYETDPLPTRKRRRQTSVSTEEKCTIVGNNESNITSDNKTQEGNDIDSQQLDDYHERKRLKKRRKSKKLHEEGKKKHRKHKFCDEHRKHKHRKHRKHKHRHNHHSSHSETSHHSSGESSSGQKSEEERSKDPLSEVIPEVEKGKMENLETRQLDLDESDPESDASSDQDYEVGGRQTRSTKNPSRQENVESRSAMAAFLPAVQLWGWAGRGYRRPGAKGRAKKQFFRAIQRGSETIQIGDSAVFLSTARADRPYIGRIESMWETNSSKMIVKVKWFYHPEETKPCPTNMRYPGALFESPHQDENDVQTISHKCEVVPLAQYLEIMQQDPQRLQAVYDNNDLYYLAGQYDPKNFLLTMQPGVV